MREALLSKSAHLRLPLLLAIKLRIKRRSGLPGAGRLLVRQLCILTDHYGRQDIVDGVFPKLAIRDQNEPLPYGPGPTPCYLTLRAAARLTRSYSRMNA